MNFWNHFTEIWVADFEFQALPGERPKPHCCVARELRSNRLVRMWITGSQEEKAGGPPYGIGENSLVVTFYGAAEAACHLVLGWDLPRNHVDLYVEFKQLTCGKPVHAGHGLLGALSYFGLDAMEAAEKREMRELAMRGGPFTSEEEEALLDYCQQDVDATARLFTAMCRYIDGPLTLIRGRYINTVAQIEANGVPLDVSVLRRLQRDWQTIQEKLIERVDRLYGVYENGTFKQARFAGWLEARGISWPRLGSGALALDKDTFRDYAKLYPVLGPLKELRATRSQLRTLGLPVGADGRNRTLLSPFASRTGRNQPKGSEFVFASAKWVRALIQPQPGRALAYLDYEQQEFGIAAKLSGDERMIEAYLTGDPYLASAKQAGSVPADATRETHGTERDRFKTVTIATQYGMGVNTLAARLKCSFADAEELLALHRRTYPRYWKWSEGVQDWAMMTGGLEASFGWRVHVGDDSNPRFLRNFPLQANGAEMLRLACIFASERGVAIAAPVHDALLIEADEAEIDDAVRRCEEAMRQASEVVLQGFALRVESKVFRYPERFPGAEESTVWRELVELLDQLNA